MPTAPESLWIPGEPVSPSSPPLLRPSLPFPLRPPGHRRLRALCGTSEAPVKTPLRPAACLPRARVCPSSGCLPPNPEALPPNPLQPDAPQAPSRPLPAPGKASAGSPSIAQLPPPRPPSAPTGAGAGLALEVRTLGRCGPGPKSSIWGRRRGRLGQLAAAPSSQQLPGAGAALQEGKRGKGGGKERSRGWRSHPALRPVPQGTVGAGGGWRVEGADPSPPPGPTCPAGRSSWWCGSCGLCSRPCRRSRAPPPSPPARAARAGASSQVRPALPHAAPGRRRWGPGSAPPAGSATRRGRPPRHHNRGRGVAVAGVPAARGP